MGPQWAWYALVFAVAYRMTESDLAAWVRRVRAASQTRAQRCCAVRVTASSPALRPSCAAAVQPVLPTGPPADAVVCAVPCEGVLR